MKELPFVEHDFIGYSVEERIRKCAVHLAREGWRIAEANLTPLAYDMMERVAGLRCDKSARYDSGGLSFVILGHEVTMRLAPTAGCSWFACRSFVGDRSETFLARIDP